MVYLVDASIYIFRAWFSIPPDMTTPDGMEVNAVYGYLHFLRGLLQTARPEYIGVAFDESLTQSYRNRIYPPYKSNRDLPPAELEHQFGLCRQLTRTLGIAEFASDTWEADDLIGSLASLARQSGHTVTIVTRDKDLAQLIRNGDRLWDYSAGRHYNYDELYARYGVTPELFADYQALTGDAVDNIPGVSGIGPATAAAVVAALGNLEAIYADIDAVEQLPVRGAKRARRLLEAGRETAFLSRQLTTINCELSLDTSLRALRCCGMDATALDGLFKQLGFGRRLYESLAGLVPTGSVSC